MIGKIEIKDIGLIGNSILEILITQLGRDGVDVVSLIDLE